MSDMEKLIERAVRAEMALKAIRTLAEQSSFGSWRHKVARLVDWGLERTP